MISKPKTAVSIDWVLTGTRSPAIRCLQFALYLEALAQSHGAGVVQVSRADLAEACAVSEMTIKRGLRRLREDGRLEVVTSPTRGRPPVYRLRY